MIWNVFVGEGDHDFVSVYQFLHLIKLVVIKLCVRYFHEIYVMVQVIVL